MLKRLHTKRCEIAPRCPLHSSFSLSLLVPNYSLSPAWASVKDFADGSDYLCPHCVSRCHRCLALVWSRLVWNKFDMEIKVSGQPPQYLCRPLLEAAWTPLHTIIQLRVDRGRGWTTLGVYLVSYHWYNTKLIQQQNESFFYETHTVISQQKYNTSAVDKHPQMCIQVRKSEIGFDSEISACHTIIGAGLSICVFS